MLTKMTGIVIKMVIMSNDYYDGDVNCDDDGDDEKRMMVMLML